MGYFEPQTPAERVKRDQDALDVYERIVTLHAKQGFRSIMPQDLNVRYRWYGLYTQRPEEDGLFMMRIRIPGGILSADQVEAIGKISQTHGGDRIEEVPDIWARLSAVQLSTQEACGDVPRNILGCPLSGIAADEIFDATPYVLGINRRITGTKEFSNLPRKFKVSVSGCRDQCGVHEIMDIGMVGIQRGDGRLGFDVWVGGGLGTNPHFAQRLGAFVPPERAEEFAAGVCSLFRDYGYRRSRNHARLKFLMADWGPEKFRDTLEQVYLSKPLEDGPAAPESNTVHREHLGLTRQADGRFAVGFAPMAGRISGTQLVRVAGLARRFGRGRIRSTTQQKMVILDVAEEDLEPLMTSLDDYGLPAQPSAFRASTMACTGIEFCKLAVVDTKARARWLVDELDRLLPGIHDRVRINLNGCPNSCARYQLADIGLMGSLLPDPDGGDRIDGFQVHLGGKLGGEYRFGTKVKGLRVPARELPTFVAGLVGTWLEDRDEGQDFSTWINGLEAPERETVVAAARG
ncbi:MAG: nitrite/sulfite reductase [Actinobacteria bacterium]|nr:nitrite/sulfite reductase [Actinomycetota bacterium]